MNASTKCPSANDLRGLLDSNPSDAENSIVVHLDHCTSCQQSLEALANSDSSLTQTLLEQTALQKPDSNSAYWPALRQAELAVTSGMTENVRSRLDVSLDFLNPPTDGTHLGSLGNFDITRVVGRG